VKTGPFADGEESGFLIGEKVDNFQILQQKARKRLFRCRQ